MKTIKALLLIIILFSSGCFNQKSNENSLCEKDYDEFMKNHKLVHYANNEIVYSLPRSSDLHKELFIFFNNKHPQCYRTHFMRSYFLREEGKFKEALSELKLASGAENIYKEYWNDKGVLLYLLKRFNDAEETFKISLSIDSEDIIPLSFLGLISTKNKKYKAAIEYLTKAINQKGYSKLSLINLAIAHEKTGNKDEAIKYTIRFIKEDKKNPEERIKALKYYKKLTGKDYIEK